MLTQVPDTYAPCARENQRCTFPGRRSVAFTGPAVTSPVLFRNAANGIDCTVASFGGVDPQPRAQKSCYSIEIPPDILNAGPNFFDSDGNPAGWTRCANEGQNCIPGAGQNVDILYGGNRNFNYVNAARIICNNQTFGDPAPGRSKACFWRRPVPVQAPQQPPPVIAPAIQTPPPGPIVTPAGQLPPVPGIPPRPPSPPPAPGMPPVDNPNQAIQTTPIEIVPTSSNRGLIIGLIGGLIALIIIILIIIIIVRSRRRA